MEERERMAYSADEFRGAVEYPGWGPYLDQFAGVLKDELMRLGLAPLDTAGAGKYNWKLSTGFASHGEIHLTARGESLYYRIDIGRSGGTICLMFLLGIVPGIIGVIIGGQNVDRAKAQVRASFETAQRRLSEGPPHG